MIKSGIDHNQLVTLFAEATARQGDALRQAVSDATLKALQGREVTLDSIKKVVKSVTAAASAGAARNPGVDAEAMLGKALAGMDQALLQAVEANRRALQQFVTSGVGLQDKAMQSAIGNVEKMEEAFFGAVAKAATSAGPMQSAWEQSLSALRVKGSDTGSQARQTTETLLADARTTMRETRASGARAAQAMLESYGALVSGVLIGMSEGMQRGVGPGGNGRSSSGAPAPAPAPSPTTDRAAPARARSAVKKAVRRR